MKKLALALGVLMSCAVFAQGFMPWTDVFMMADSNKDGGVSMDEVNKFMAADHFLGFQPFMRDHFKDLDTNGDGMVSMYELKVGTHKMQMTDEESSRMFYRGLGFMPANR